MLGDMLGETDGDSDSDGLILGEIDGLKDTDGDTLGEKDSIPQTVNEPEVERISVSTVFIIGLVNLAIRYPYLINTPALRYI